jgi:large subunit ribosomal protein L31
MKKGIHPKYRKVVFEDVSVGVRFILGSSVETRDTIVMDDGEEYPLYKLGVSRHSHPFYTGDLRQIDVEGRIDKFRRRYSKNAPATPEAK